MNFTPNDIQNIEFKKTMFGYSEDMVNDVLDKIIEDYSYYIHESIELKDRVGVLNEAIQHYKKIEDSLQETLNVAQKTSDEIKKNARDKSEMIEREAKMAAQKTIGEAQQEVNKIRHEYDETKKEMRIFKTRIESLLTAQVELLNTMFDEQDSKKDSREKENIRKDNKLEDLMKNTGLEKESAEIENAKETLRMRTAEIKKIDELLKQSGITVSEAEKTKKIEKAMAEIENEEAEHENTLEIGIGEINAEEKRNETDRDKATKEEEDEKQTKEMMLGELFRKKKMFGKGQAIDIDEYLDIEEKD